jgi:hypothetical protein
MKELPRKIDKKSVPINESDVLAAAVLDASFTDLGTSIGGSKLQKLQAGTIKSASFFMKNLDYAAREITWRAKYKELQPRVKKGKMSKEEAIRRADETVIRTQSSGAPGEIAPIQRSAIGKMLTLWQTFTIGHINWLAKEVMGIKNPEATPVRTASRVLRYLIGMSALGYVFEDLIGIQAPGPAPIQALKREIQAGEKDPFKLALTTGREISELVPFGSSIKFGSSVFGPVVDFLGQVTDIAAGTGFFDKDVLAKAKGGDVKSIVKVLEVAGKLGGVPATAQVAKAARGLLRDENLLRAMIGRIPEVKKPSKKKKKKRGKSRSRRRRQRR